VNTYVIASEETRRYETTYLSQAKDALRSTEASYREGAVSLLEFLEAERAYTQTQRDHLKALLNANVAAFGVASAAALDPSP
ncbi:MAG TPA: TolC family protein, partial [Candidatus Binatus sp.]|nr:TolC family protein [Candidatus Binatus sp.]